MRYSKRLPKYVHRTPSGKYRVSTKVNGVLTQLSKSLDTVKEAEAFVLSHPELCAKAIAKQKANPNPASVTGKILALLETSPGKLVEIDKSIYDGKRAKLATALYHLRYRYLYNITSHYKGKYYRLTGHWRNPDGEYYEYPKEMCTKVITSQKTNPNPASMAGKILALLEASPGKEMEIDKSICDGNRLKLNHAIEHLRNKYLYNITSHYDGSGKNINCKYKLSGHWRNPDGEYYEYPTTEWKKTTVKELIEYLRSMPLDEIIFFLDEQVEEDIICQNNN